MVDGAERGGGVKQSGVWISVEHWKRICPKADDVICRRGKLTEALACLQDALQALPPQKVAARTHIQRYVATVEAKLSRKTPSAGHRKLDGETLGKT
jgi:hypothetical protein